MQVEIEFKFLVLIEFILEIRKIILTFKELQKSRQNKKILNYFKLILFCIDN